MSQNPFMQLYVGDYLADTLDLTTEQHGAYLLLLMTMWRHDANLPNDPAKLARIARVSLRRWHLVWGEIQHFFYVDGDEIRNKRLDREHQKASSISEKRIASGAAGGRAKALKDKEAHMANASNLPQHSQKPEPEEKEDTNVSSKKTAENPPDEVGLDFSAFWDVYPHRGGQKKNRKGAEARYRAAIKSGATAEQIMAGVNAMSAFPDVQRGYARDPATWLNQAGWTDEAPSGFAVIKGGVDKSMWVEGALRAVSPTNIQEYVCGSWEKRNDLTEEQVTGHPKYIGRTRAYAV